MFALSLVVIFLIVCLIDYIGLRISGKEISENSGISIVFKSFLSLISAYIMICLIEFKFMPIPSLNKFHFGLAVLITVLVNGFILVSFNRERIFQVFHKESKMRYVAVGISILAIVFIAELTIFNFRHYESMGYPGKTVTNYSLSPGLELGENNSIIVKEEGEKSIVIDPIKGYANNIYIDMAGEPNKPLRVQLFVRDEGSSGYYWLPNREIYQENQRSKYLRLHLYGEARGIKIQIDAPPGTKYSLREIGFNKKVPFVFSIQRCIFLQVVLMIFYLIRPKSPLYLYRINFKSKIQMGIILLLICLQVLLMSQLVKLNPAWTGPPNGHHAQYHQLVESFIEGKVHLKEQPPKELIALENPYDITLRDANQVPYFWDAAFYNEKYYVYFGVGPVLFFYLPYYLLTGDHMLTYVGIFMVGAALVCSIFALTGVIVKRWFPKIPFLIYLLVTLYFINASGLPYIVIRPDFYSFAIILGMFFSIFGITMWLNAVKENGVSKVLLFLGSVSMALVAICRPQLLIGSFLAFPIFWNSVFKERTLFSKDSKMSTALFVLPFVFVATGVMMYNAARFSSVFDFGASYNLTTNDMTRRGFVLERTLLGLYAYLVQPTTISNEFPFVFYKGLFTSYQGKTIAENPIGGLIFNNLLMICPFFLAYFKKMFKNKREPYLIAMLSTVFTLILVAVDTQAGGILMRYLADFSWLLLIATAIVAFAISNYLRAGTHKRIWHTLVVTSFAVSVLIQCSVAITEIKYDLGALTNNISYLIQFWL